MAGLIRPVRESDAPALAEIYGWHCRNGTGTFEETPPDAAAMRLRMSAVLEGGDASLSDSLTLYIIDVWFDSSELCGGPVQHGFVVHFELAS